MAITHTKLEIMNSALRMVGSYHLESDDTTSATYEIATRAYENAVNAIFSNNIFQFNTKRLFSTGTSVANDADSTKPNNFLDYRHSLPSDYNLLLQIQDKKGEYIITDFLLDGINSDITDATVPYLYTTDESVHIYYQYVPDLETDASKMPSFLARLISLYMAQEFAIELSGSESRQGVLFAQYQQALRRARVLEGRSSPAQTYINDGNSRLMGSHYGYGSV